ncbi:hypothetical protein LCGC14_1277620 [marine sediment metagenome]|uniref:LarC family nickel insertion protein n=1 Tax=marine sediment metagenome TaxID=412755 RepID=A0A0F9KW51_9ZZZZ
MSLRLRLDPVGGIAGDMAAAALLDSFPDAVDAVARGLSALPLPAELSWQHLKVSVAGLQGQRFEVTLAGKHEGAAAHDARHSHRHHADIRAMLTGGALPAPVAAHADAIFDHLARAEAQVHGCAVADVAFHEVGAWDSIVDIVTVAAILAEIGPAQWFCGPVPLGHGTVWTEHGRIPVPAPATALLLQGMLTHDDGIGGERVTPTGAAILRHLAPDQGPMGPARLRHSGTGFGQREVPGHINALRVLVFDGAGPETGPPQEQIARLGFELDDQTPEEIATALDRLRAHPGVQDVVSLPVMGKKGRLAQRIEILAAPEGLPQLLTLCFDETTTLGIRHETLWRSILPRRADRVETAQGTLRVKIADRPGGPTVKAEADDLAALSGDLRDRRAARAQAEAPPQEVKSS